jgi:membrane protease YdiL (CAAX protease family)
MKLAFPQRRPIVFSLLLVLMFVVALSIASIVSSALKLSTVATTAIGYSLLTVAVVILLSRLHWWRKIGLGLPAQRGLLWYFVVAFLPVLLNGLSVGAITSGVGLVLFMFGTAMLVGFVEEVVFRGMMLQALLIRGPWQAAIISSLIFGCAHALNLLSGANVVATLLQIGAAMALGFMFAALALRTHTILPLIVAHGLINFFGFLAYNSSVVTTGLSGLVILVTAVEILLYTSYGVFLMRQIQARTAAAAPQPPSLTMSETVWVPSPSQLDCIVRLCATCDGERQRGDGPVTWSASPHGGGVCA